MTPCTPRICTALLALVSLAACGSAPESATAEPASAAPTQAVAPATPEDAPAGAAAPSSAAPAAGPAAVPAGYYECYFHGDYGLQNSSMTSLRIHGPAEYEAMDERGRYTEAEGALRMESGPLDGRVAHMRESSGKPAIVFLRRENEAGGRPTIDIGDTWCYFDP